MQSLSTSVVQLFTTRSPDHSTWLKEVTGVLCLVKDSNKRSYFCRIYCLMRNELVWEQELYTTIEFRRARPYLISFEGETGHVALNFAADPEADHFHQATSRVLEARQRKRRRNPPPRPTGSTTGSQQQTATTAAPTPTTLNSSRNNMDDGVQLRNPPPQPMQFYQAPQPGMY